MSLSERAKQPEKGGEAKSEIPREVGKLEEDTGAHLENEKNFSPSL